MKPSQTRLELTEMQEYLAMKDDSKSWEEVACQWIKTNRPRWETWVPKDTCICLKNKTHIFDVKEFYVLRESRGSILHFLAGHFEHHRIRHASRGLALLMWPGRAWPAEATPWGVGYVPQELVLRCSWMTLEGLTPASPVSLVATKNSLGRPYVSVVPWEELRVRLGFRNVRLVLLGALPILSVWKSVRFVALVAFNGPRVARLNFTEVSNGSRLKLQCQQTTAIVFRVIS